jgi:hypothetical protein
LQYNLQSTAIRRGTKYLWNLEKSKRRNPHIIRITSDSDNCRVSLMSIRLFGIARKQTNWALEAHFEGFTRFP